MKYIDVTFYGVGGEKVSIQSSQAHWGCWRLWSSRLAFVEIALCIAVPCFGIFLWSQYDDELRTALLAGPDQLHAHEVNAVYDVIMTNDDTAIVVHAEGQIQFWNVSQWSCLGEFQSLLFELRSAAYSEQQRLLAVGSIAGELEVWDLDHSNKPIATLSTTNAKGVEACEFTPDGRFLCSASNSGEIVFWEARTLQKAFSFVSSVTDTTIRSLEFTPDGQFLLTGNKHGVVEIWDLQKRALARTLRMSDATYLSASVVADSIVEAIRVMPGGHECVIVTRSSGISVWDMFTGECLRRWAADAEPIHSANLSGDGKRLITGNTLGEITTWNTATGERVQSLQTHTRMVRALATNRDGTVVVSGDCLGDSRCRPN